MLQPFRWVFKVKCTEDGSIEWHKARLVAQGFSQQPGWDFVENFAPTIRLSVIRAIFALVAAEDMECDSLDITTAFLNRELEDTIYMKPPPLFEQYSPQGKRLYCLLDLGPSKWFLGIHITRDRAKRTLSLSQRQYCIDMLTEFDMLDARPVPTPMVKRLTKEDCPKTPEDVEFMKDKLYMRAVGMLI